MKQSDKSLATRQRVMATAHQLFSEKGYDAATLQDIIQLSGLSKGAIYHHFSSKQDILQAMIAAAQARTNAFFAEVADDASTSVPEKIDRVIDYFAGSAQQQLLLRNGWAEKIPFALLETIRSNTASVAPQIARIIRQGNSAGQCQCEYPEEVAEVLLLLLSVWLDPVVNPREPGQIERRVRFAAAFLRRFAAPLIDEAQLERLLAAYSSHSGGENNG